MKISFYYLNLKLMIIIILIYNSTVFVIKDKTVFTIRKLRKKNVAIIKTILGDQKHRERIKYSRKSSQDAYSPRDGDLLNDSGIFEENSDKGSSLLLDSLGRTYPPSNKSTRLGIN